MIITSKEINLSQLGRELGNRGLVGNFTNPQQKLIKPADGSTITEIELQAAIEAHIAIPEPEPTVEEKLASVGLNLTDLKTALGL